MTPIESMNVRVQKLMALGLGECEARTYMVMSTTEPMQARDIAHESRVPRTKIYSVLEGLIGRGLVDLIAARPKQYRRLPIDVLISTMIADHEKQILELTEASAELDTGESMPEETEETWKRRKDYLVAIAIAYGVPEVAARENAEFLTRFKLFVVEGTTKDQRTYLALAFLEGSATPSDDRIGDWVQLILRGDPDYETYKDLKRFFQDVPGDFEKFHQTLKALQGKDPRPIAAASR